MIRPAVKCRASQNQVRLECLRSLCFTRCICVGSDGGDSPALLTATIRNWYSPRSFRSTTLPSSLSPSTSPAFSQSGLYLNRRERKLMSNMNIQLELWFKGLKSVRLLVFFFDDVFLDGNAAIYGGCSPLQVDATVVVVNDVRSSRGSRLF